MADAPASSLLAIAVSITETIDGAGSHTYDRRQYRCADPCAIMGEFYSGPEALQMNLFIFGLGYSARAIVGRLGAQCREISGTTRSDGGMAAIGALGVNAYLFDGERPGPGINEALRSASHLLVSIGPNAKGDPALNHHGADLAAATDLRWIGYLSTVGVYGNHDGAWVDEESPCSPVSDRSRWRLAAETRWREMAAELGVPLAIFRLSGIYGPGRNGFVNLTTGRAKRIIKPGQVFNRIYVEDIASAVALAAEGAADGVFNITDNEPAPPQDVVAYAADLMGMTPPPEVDFATADMTAMARSFYGENKRVSNARAKAELGWAPSMPTYREALTALWQSGTWRGQ